MVGRLDFSVPEFVRTIWASEDARNVWEERISEVSRMYQELEIQAVQIGTKPAAIQTCSPDALAGMTNRLAKFGLVVAPLSQEGVRNSYSSATTPYDPVKPWTYRIIITKPHLVSPFLELWQNRDDCRIGEMLGYPVCCQNFFRRYWVDEGYRDLTYPMVINETRRTRHFEVSGHSSCNVLLRWIGVRRVSHLPCRFDCSETRIIGDAMQKLAEDLFPREAMFLAEMLDWPIRWSSLHGIAIITTPVVRIVTSSDPLTDNVLVDWKGSTYPAEGATGIEFPFQKTYPIKLKKRDSSLWKDNGFENYPAMDAAHKILLKALGAAEVPAITRTLDLGCGNGVLLEKVGSMFQTELHGIESDHARWERAMQRLKDARTIIAFGDFFKDIDWKSNYGLVVVAINRILELDQSLRQRFIGYLADTTDYLLVYSYDGKEMNFSWSNDFNFITGEQSEDKQTIAYLLRSLKHGRT